MDFGYLIEEASLEDVISIEDLVSDYANYRDTHGKAYAILRGVSGITSVIASSIMVWMILRSYEGLSTPRHRLLFGLCICDILASLSHSTFNAMQPLDIYYSAWNVRGNEATCTAQGFLTTLGGYGGVCYNSALNLYFLAVVKYEKSNEHIRVKIEPFLHGVPIVISFSYSVARLVKEQYNADDSGSMPCIMYYHYPAHCQGYGVGEIRDGFEIPCGRGLDGASTSSIIGQTLLIIPILIMVGSLGVIYRSVRKREKKLEKYGVGALRATVQNPEITSGNYASGATRFSTLLTSIKSLFCRSLKSSNKSTVRSNDAHSKSRAVMHKAFGYSFFWFLSYGIILIGVILKITTDSFPIAVRYMSAILNPLQGLFNLLIYMHPKIMAARRGGRNISWCKAFFQALWSRGGNIRKKSVSRSTGVRGDNKENRRLVTKDTLKATKKQVREAKAPIETDYQKEEEKCEITSTEELSSCQVTSNSMYVSNISLSIYKESSENNRKL